MVSSFLLLLTISDENNGEYLCEAINIVGVGNEKFEVRAVWEFAEVDELGNYIGIKYNENSATKTSFCFLIILISCIFY